MLNVKKYRQREKMSQMQLSVKADVSQSVIADIETGVAKNPTVGTALKLAKALNCTVEELVQEDGPKEAAI